MAAQPFDRSSAGAEAQAFFARLWASGDPWDLDGSPLDQARYSKQLAMLDDRRYSRVLEVGCGAGSFTERLAGIADFMLAIDIAEPALQRAAERTAGPTVSVRLLNVMDLDPADGGPWDLVVIAETIYYLGWLYPMFDVAWLLHALYDATTPGGRLLLSDTVSDDYGIMSHWLIRSYRDLARNVGYEPERSEVLRGEKQTVDFEVLLDLFGKPTS